MVCENQNQRALSLWYVKTQTKERYHYGMWKPKQKSVITMVCENQNQRVIGYMKNKNAYKIQNTYEIWK